METNTMVVDLEATIRHFDQFPMVKGQHYRVPTGYCTPGHWVLLAAKSCHLGLKFGDLVFPQGREEYAKAMKLECALDGEGTDTYPHRRKNVGVNYSPIISLSCADLTDDATSTINSCLRAQANGAAGISDLAAIVGELHDNVWSHGQSTGFSMAQKRRVPRSDDYFIEFALADAGIGLKSEMARAKRRVSSHREAIDWCLQEGNSTKLNDDDDGWAQRLPEDHYGQNPYGPEIATISKPNHHQGLGLAKLVQLVKKYDASLQFVTGDCLYKISEDGQASYSLINREWQGVAISCRLRISRLLSVNKDTDCDERVEYIMRRLEEP
jgi:hypothetical protein